MSEIKEVESDGGTATEVPREARAVARCMEITFPARVHMTLIDGNQFDSGAGGIGLAVDMENVMNISLDGRDGWEPTGDSALLIAHMITTMKKVLNYQGGIRVEIRNNRFLRPHIGLGYSTCILTSCAYGINALLGSPLSLEEVRRVVGSHYVEVLRGELVRESESGAVSTGVGSFLTIMGGLVIVGGNFTVLYSKKTLEGYHVALIDPGVKRLPYEQGTLPAMKKILKEDEAFRYHKSYLILMRLIPALDSEDFEAVGNIIWRFQFGGNNLVEPEKYEDGGKRILDVMHTVRFSQKKKPIVGITAEGPIIFAISHDVDGLQRACDKLGVSALITKVDNNGLKITSKGVVT